MPPEWFGLALFYIGWLIAVFLAMGGIVAQM